MIRYREVNDADCRRVQECILDMQEAQSLDETAVILSSAAMNLVECDHGSYTEVDLYFDRSRLLSNVSELQEWAERRAGAWQKLMPTHPLLKFRNKNPHVPAVRLSDVTNLPTFYESEIYNELFREFDTNFQLVMQLGFNFGGLVAKEGRLPITVGVPLNRKGSDFSIRDVEVLSLLQRLAHPILCQMRVEHQSKLMASAELSPEMLRSLMSFGLTPPQSEVVFWMLKGKSNTDIGTILDIGTQAVRQRSIAIFQKLGVDGRIALQHEVIRTLANIA